MICPKCQAEIPADAEACAKCGTGVTEEHAPPEAVRTILEMVNNAVFGLFFGGILGAVFGVVLMAVACAVVCANSSYGEIGYMMINALFAALFGVIFGVIVSLITGVVVGADFVVVRGGDVGIASFGAVKGAVFGATIGAVAGAVFFTFFYAVLFSVVGAVVGMVVVAVRGSGVNVIVFGVIFAFFGVLAYVFVEALDAIFYDEVGDNSDIIVAGWIAGAVIGAVVGVVVCRHTNRRVGA